jgi:hypothetical protein
VGIDRPFFRANVGIKFGNSIVQAIEIKLQEIDLTQINIELKAK